VYQTCNNDRKKYDFAFYFHQPPRGASFSVTSAEGDQSSQPLRRDPLRLVFGEQPGRQSPARLLLVIDPRKLLPVAVYDDKARAQFDSPGRRKRRA
jgi:hypothetical protein